ncbi:MAG TPA: hypothetical protein VN809_15490, partial [Telmatospirillum sp.]|nr:hypothetical protein [Telmatospirillum sp.]
MTITADEAAEALASIDDVAKRARMALGYEAGAPMLMLWGVIWVICFGVGWLETHHAAVVAWMWLAPIGGLTSCAWGLWRQKFQRDKTAGSIGWLWLAMWGFGIL